MKTIWTITNSNGTYIKAFATREEAKDYLREWRESIVNSGIFAEVGKLEEYHYEKMKVSFTTREGQKKAIIAREETLLF